MPFAYQGVCHTLQSSANNAFCQSMTLNGLTTTGDVVAQTCTAVTATGITLSRLVKTTTTAQTVAFPPYLACNWDGGVSMSQDYFLKGIGFLAVLFAAKHLQTLLKGRSDHA